MSLIRLSKEFAELLTVAQIVALLRLQLRFERQLGHADDGVHRRANLVAHVGQELALRASRFFRFLLFDFQLLHQFGKPLRILFLGVPRGLQVIRVYHQIVFHATPFDELPYLTPDGIKHGEQLRIDFARLAREKFDHAREFRTGANWERKGRAQALLMIDSDPGETSGFGYFTHPNGLACLPDVSGQAYAARRLQTACSGFEFRELRSRRTPKFYAVQ